VQFYAAEMSFSHTRLLFLISCIIIIIIVFVNDSVPAVDGGSAVDDETVANTEFCLHRMFRWTPFQKFAAKLIIGFGISLTALRMLVAYMKVFILIVVV
jgi:hypothetical protein